MSTNNQLAIREEPSVALMLQGIIEKGITAESVAVMGQLVALKERMDAKQAEKDFVSDFVALKQAMPAIHAIKAVLNKDGSIRYQFAPLEEIDRILRPVALEHGFTYSFTEQESPRAGTIAKVCVIQHKSGHSSRHPYSVRIGGGPPGSTESQSDGAAHSYAKRGALCDAFGIVIERDTDGSDDARNLGKPISKQQADTLRRGVKEAGADEAAFLAFAEAKSYEDIFDTRYEDLRAMLARKAQKKGTQKLDPVGPDGNFQF